jgi:hypothetical protein
MKRFNQEFGNLKCKDDLCFRYYIYDMYEHLSAYISPHTLTLLLSRYHGLLLLLRLCRIHYNNYKICQSSILKAIHLNDNSLFCVIISLDIIHSLNSLFITEIIVSFLFLWLYSVLEEYPLFICFLYLPYVLHIGMCLNLADIILNAWMSSLLL